MKYNLLKNYTGYVTSSYLHYTDKKQFLMQYVICQLMCR